MTKKIGPSTVARIAGNILSGHRPSDLLAPYVKDEVQLSERDRELVDWAVEMARAIVLCVELREDEDDDDVPTLP